MRKQFKVLYILLLMSLLSFTAVVYSDTLDDLEKHREELKESFEGNEDELVRLQQEYNEIVNKVIELNSIISEKNRVLLETIAKREKIEEEIEETKDELKIAIEEEAVYKEQVIERIQIMYEYGEVNYYTVLFESKDIGDFFNRLEYLTKVFKFDEIMLEKLEEMHEKIEAKKTNLEINQSVLLDIEADISDEKERLEQLVFDKRKEESKIIENRVFLEMQQIKLEEDLKENENLIKKELLRGKYSFKDGDTFAWPTPGYYRITSPFGERIHPIFGSYGFHYGTDIGAPYGAKIIAAADGEVSFSGVNGGYGNLVVINHGNNYYTYYGHCTTLLVKVGEAVVMGEDIATVGTTGNSTGPHLHFGVKKDGVWVDAMNYFDRE